MTSPSVRHPGEFRWETRLLAVVTLVLTVFGIANCYAAATYLEAWFNEATDQVSAALIGGVVFLAAAYSDYQVWRRLARPLFFATVFGLAILALVALIFGKKSSPDAIGAVVPLLNGARRWIKIGPVTIQLSEIARFTLTAFVATRAVELGTKVRNFQAGFVQLIAPIALVVALVAAEPNLSMAIVLGVAGGMVVFTAGARIGHVLLLALVGIGGAGAMIAFSEFRSDRLDRYRDAAAACDPILQECASLIGYGNGGIVGVGFGEGTQKLGHLPYGYSDFILSAIAEEWGLIGVCFMTLCFGLFCWMGFRIAKTARDPFGMFLASGLTAMVGLAAFLHAAVVTQLIPATGLTLPFVSAGRVSLIMYLFSAGVIVSVGRRRGRPARER